MTTQSRDIVERLRSEAEQSSVFLPPDVREVINEAAKEIEHLRSQVDRIRAILGSEA